MKSVLSLTVDGTLSPDPATHNDPIAVTHGSKVDGRCTSTCQQRSRLSQLKILEVFWLWRTRSRERSALFRAPQTVIRELKARGMNVGHEAAKPFWQP